MKYEMRFTLHEMRKMISRGEFICGFYQVILKYFTETMKEQNKRVYRKEFLWGRIGFVEMMYFLWDMRGLLILTVPPC